MVSRFSRKSGHPSNRDITANGVEQLHGFRISMDQTGPW